MKLLSEMELRYQSLCRNKTKVEECLIIRRLKFLK